jgi:hypothetical protein
MTPSRIYLLGTVLVVGVGLGIVALVPAARGTPSLVALLVGSVVQAPLGWFLVRSVKTPRFLGVWVIGILARFALLAVMALVVFPGLRWPLTPGLLILAGVLVLMLFVEALVVWLQQSRVEAR